MYYLLVQPGNEEAADRSWPKDFDRYGRSLVGVIFEGILDSWETVENFS